VCESQVRQVCMCVCLLPDGMTGESQVSTKAIYLNWELYLFLLIDIYSRLDGRLEEFLSYLLNGGRMVSLLYCYTDRIQCKVIVAHTLP